MKRGIFGGGWCHYIGVTTVVENPSSLAFFRGFHGFSCKGLAFIDLSIRTVERISWAWALAAMIHHCSYFQLWSLKTQRDFFTLSCHLLQQRHVQRNSPKVAGNMTDPLFVVFLVLQSQILAISKSQTTISHKQHPQNKKIQKVPSSKKVKQHHTPRGFTQRISAERLWAKLANFGAKNCRACVRSNWGAASHQLNPRGEVLATLRGGESLWNRLKSRFSPNQKKKLCNKYRTSRPTKNHRITSPLTHQAVFDFCSSQAFPWQSLRPHEATRSCKNVTMSFTSASGASPGKWKRHITWFFLTWWLDNNYHKRIHMTLPL